MDLYGDVFFEHDLVSMDIEELIKYIFRRSGYSALVFTIDQLLSVEPRDQRDQGLAAEGGLAQLRTSETGGTRD